MRYATPASEGMLSSTRVFATKTVDASPAEFMKMCARGNANPHPG